MNSLIFAQNLKFDHLTEVLLNQNPGRHLGELINNKPNNQEHVSTPHMNMMLIKALGPTTQNTMGICLPAKDLIMDHAIKKDMKTRQGKCMIAQTLLSLNQMRNRLFEAKWWKGSNAPEGKDPRAKDM